MSGKKENKFVSATDCLHQHVNIDAKMLKFDTALFGTDGRGGIVRDIAEIKTATGFLRQILTPIIASLVTAGIMYLLLKGA